MTIRIDIDQNWKVPKLRDAKFEGIWFKNILRGYTLPGALFK